jgi:hypothetical protein
MKFVNKVAQIALVLSALPIASMAGESGTVYTQLSTNGLGLGYATSVNDDFAVRGQVNYLKQSFSGNVGDFGSAATLAVDINLSSVQLVADWYPTASGFRLTGGGVINNNKITVAGTGASFGTASGQTVNGEIKLSDGISPYLGLGYSAKPKDAKGLGLNFDLGVMFQNPKVTLTSTGTVNASQTDIDAQIAKVQDAVNNLKVMPVIGLGISYSF